VVKIDLTDLQEEISDKGFSHLSRVGPVFIGSKVESEEHAQQILELDIDLAIDLKNKGETPLDDQVAFEKIGITYHNIPISDLSQLTFEDIQHFSELIKSSQKNVLVYCMSGNRVSALLALYFSLALGHPKNRSLEIAEKLGLTKAPLKEKVIQYFEKASS
jgi:protein tyrosine phosphatase (PTP) superfamily phosphohydrolase (DUF442 family)